MGEDQEFKASLASVGQSVGWLETLSTVRSRGWGEGSVAESVSCSLVNLNSVSSTYIGGSSLSACNSNSRGSHAVFWPHRHPTNTHIPRKKKVKTKQKELTGNQHKPQGPQPSVSNRTLTHTMCTLHTCSTHLDTRARACPQDLAWHTTVPASPDVISSC